MGPNLGGGEVHCKGLNKGQLAAAKCYIGPAQAVGLSK